MLKEADDVFITILVFFVLIFDNIEDSKMNDCIGLYHKKKNDTKVHFVDKIVFVKQENKICTLRFTETLYIFCVIATFHGKSKTLRQRPVDNQGVGLF